MSNKSVTATNTTTTALIIPTKDRATILESTLGAVLDQTITPDEIIVIDQSAASDTQSVVRRVSQRPAKPSIRWLYVHAPAVAGPGPARNIGIERSSATVLVFLDDDILVDKDYLREILGAYDRDASIGGVSGIITNYRRPELRERFFDRFFCLGPFRDERLPIYWNADRLRAAALIPLRKVSGGVMSVRRSALGCERFEETYCGRGEDVDLSWRVSEFFPLVLAPGARAVHLTEAGGRREHWLASAVTAQSFLYHKLWKNLFKNRICFAWLTCGWASIAIVSAILRRSLDPLRALMTGLRRARDLRSAPQGGSRSQHLAWRA